MYAVIKTGGKQLKVSKGDFIKIERIKGEEKEFHSYLTLTSGKLKIGATVGENLFIFDYYAPVKLFHKYLIKNGISLFTVKEVGFFENDYERNEWELYINKGVNSKIFVRGKVLKGDINLLEIPVKEIKIKGKALHLNMKLGKKESIVKVDIDSVSFMGKIEIPPPAFTQPSRNSILLRKSITFQTA